MSGLKFTSKKSQTVCLRDNRKNNLTNQMEENNLQITGLLVDFCCQFAVNDINYSWGNSWKALSTNFIGGVHISL